jgi:primosomal protein N' (replication factor Y) (superfamily II helicase)
MSAVSILLPLPLPEAFDYAVPLGMSLNLGDIVEVPLGKQTRIGVVWAVKPDSEGSNLKPVIAKFDTPPLSQPMREFVDFAARYLVTPPGQVLAMTLRNPEALGPGPMERLAVASGILPDKLNPARQRVLDLARQPIPRAQLAKEAGVGSSVITGLLKSGSLSEIERPIDTPFGTPNPDLPARPLSDIQSAAAATISDAIVQTGFAPFLLDGVTGSGKTEVYLEAVASALRADPDGQILILLPEIALTQAIMARFEDRFGTQPAQWHYEVAAPAKRRAWREVSAGRARIVIGARSALFLPFAKLSLIIVDEEHDGSYKQDDGLRYHARDMAVARAKFEGATIVLGSATPSLETRINADAGRYKNLVLPARYGVALLPEIELIDLKSNPPERDKWISPILLEAAAQTLSRGEQVLLFLNRRGFAPVVLCRKCGHRMKAPDTQSWLVEHKYSNRLVCHLTGFSMRKPDACPNCGAPDGLVSVGPGVERIAAEVAELFPQARAEIFSSDTVHNPSAVRDLVGRMERGEIDILIGTQIVAKGHNFPGLTLVGVIDADLGLTGGDPRAGERTYQMLSQVAGRAGRADRPGRALIQTHYPDNEALQALVSGDRDAFIEAESQGRAAMGAPPFGRMAAMHLMAQSDEAVGAAAKAASEALFGAQGVEVWGPAPPPIAMVRGWRRRRFIIQADRSVDLSAFMAAWRSAFRVPASVRVSIDIDPYSFL